MGYPFYQIDVEALNYDMSQLRFASYDNHYWVLTNYGILLITDGLILYRPYLFS